MDRHQLDQIKQSLFDCADRFKSDELFPTLVPEALDLVKADPYAFAIAVSLDRGTKADVIWTIPFYLKNELGHLDPARIDSMTLDELASAFLDCPRDQGT